RARRRRRWRGRAQAQLGELVRRLPVAQALAPDERLARQAPQLRQQVLPADRSLLRLALDVEPDRLAHARPLDSVTRSRARRGTAVNGTLAPGLTFSRPA